MNSLRPLLALLCLLAPALHAQEKAPPPPASPLETKFREGLYAEEAKQDLAAAAKAYQEIVAGFDRDRETASSALFRLGEVYRKQNRPKEAAAAFRRVALEFPDRDPLARLARENLAALGEPLPMVPGAAAPAGADSSEDKALARLRELEKVSPDLILSPLTSLKANGCISFDEALEAGYLRVVQWFTEHGASMDRTPSGNTPLSLAARNGRAPVVEFLLEKKALVEGPENTVPPLTEAAKFGHRAMVLLLLDKGAPVNGRPGQPHPLTAAVEQAHRTVIELLLERKADPDIAGGAALMTAVYNAKQDLVDLLLKYKADPDKSSRILFRHSPPGPVTTTPATGRRRVNLSAPNESPPPPPPVQYTWDGLEKQTEPLPLYYGGYGGTASSDTVFALHLAVLRRNDALVEQLLTHGADPNLKTSNGNSALEFALVHQLDAIGSRLIKAGADVNFVRGPGPGLSLLEMAVQRQDLKFYDLLLKAGAALNRENPDGITSLLVLRNVITADEEKNLPMFERLLNDGADPNAPPEWPPLITAAEIGSEKLIRLLGKKGADFTPDKADAPLPTLFRNGVDERKMGAFEALLEGGADINAVSNKPNPDNSSVSWETRLTCLEVAAAWMPDLSLLERILAHRPHIRGSFNIALDEYQKARKLLAMPRPPGEQKADQMLVRDVYYGQREPHRTVGDKQKVAERAPAILRRLWDYQFMDQNKDLRTRVWFHTFTLEPDNPRGAWCPAAMPGDSVNVADALAYAFGPGRSHGSEPNLPWHTFGKAAIPDLKKLTILRCDPDSGKVIKREPLDLTALAEKGDPSLLPVLKPGDILDAVPVDGTDWRWNKLPEPLPAFFVKALGSRSVTVKSGDWTHLYRFRPGMANADPGNNFRMDPASEIVPNRPLLSRLLQWLPKPDFCYRIDRVTVKSAGKPPVIVNMTKPAGDKKSPPPPAPEVVLQDGDEVICEPVPSDDPALVARMREGIFISREQDGFLYEVFHDPARPDLTTAMKDGTLASQVLLRFCLTSRFVLPFTGAEKFIPGPDGSPWGGRLEVSRWPDADGKKWTGPQNADGPRLARPLCNLLIGVKGEGEPVPYPFYLREDPNIYAQVPFGWEFRGSGQTLLQDCTLASVLRSLKRNQPAQQWTAWELYRSGGEKPLFVFKTGDKEAIPFIFLRDGDSLLVSREDAGRITLPNVRRKNDNGTVEWEDGPVGLPGFQLPPVPSPRRRTRTVLPTQ